GSSAGNALAGTNGTTFNGGVAPAGGGNGGNGVNSSTNNGNGANGTVPGGGGGGGKRTSGSTTRNGGNGAGGQVVVSYTLPNGPGGITAALQLWLRADLVNGTSSVADNTNVSSWQTQAMGSN